MTTQEVIIVALLDVTDHGSIKDFSFLKKVHSASAALQRQDGTRNKCLLPFLCWIRILSVGVQNNHLELI